MITFYDTYGKEELSKKIVNNRIKNGLKDTIGVWMLYKDYEKLKGDGI